MDTSRPGTACSGRCPSAGPRRPRRRSSTASAPSICGSISRACRLASCWSSRRAPRRKSSCASASVRSPPLSASASRRGPARRCTSPRIGPTSICSTRRPACASDARDRKINGGGGTPMANIITRRDALRLTVGGTAALAFASEAGAQIPRADVAAPSLPFEKDAKLRILRPARFVEPDETLFRANTAKFQQTTGVETRVDFVGWEDMRQQSAVAANTGTGPDIVIGWSEDPHVYADKIIELSDLAEYLGKRYGGWTFLAEKYGKKDKTKNWLAIPFGGGTGPICYRKSAVKEAGFDAIPHDHATYLKLLQALKKINKPAGFALGNAVGDGNGFANWLIWSHGAYLVDEAGKVAINSKETINALNYLKDLYPTFVPGTLAWGDPSNNKAYAASECWLTANGVSLDYALKKEPATRAIAEETG